jgi:ribosomal-protein-alanine N-acetyltransferase
VSPERPAPRVELRTPRSGDEPAYREAVLRSVELIAPWNPADPDDFAHLLTRMSSDGAVFLVVDRTEGGIAGKVTVNMIQRGRLSSAALGYDAYVPYAGTGRMTEALRLVLDTCFAPAPEGLGLHRVEVNIQPGNERSLRLVRRVGFRHEGFSPRLLFLNGAWRDHERFALTAEEWPPTAAH